MGGDVEEGALEVEAFAEVFAEGAYAPDFGGVMSATEEIDGELIGDGGGDMVGFAGEEKVDAAGGGLVDIESGIACDDGDLLDGFASLSEEASHTVEGLEDLGDAFGKGGGLGGSCERAANPDDLAFVISPRLEIVETELTGKDGVIANLWMSIQREVGGIESGIMLDQGLDALVVCTDQKLAATPKEAVMTQDKLCADGGGLTKALLTCIHREGDVFDRTATMNLKTILRHIAKKPQLEIIVEVAAKFIERDHQRSFPFLWVRESLCWEALFRVIGKKMRGASFWCILSAESAKGSV